MNGPLLMFASPGTMLPEDLLEIAGTDMDAREGYARIELLPDDVVDRIAAGEVVERPASVVKELVENALDAGSDQITVAIIADGTTEIRVLDNGVGMSLVDAERSILRHATSKIRSDADLVTIGTFGFRGEALPAIASVSRMRIETGRGLDGPGTLVCPRNGAHEALEAAPRRGTLVVVEDLFGSVPARRKFLKTERTEFNQIRRVVRQAALAHPEVGFRLEHNGKKVWSLPRGQDQAGRCRAVFPKGIGRRLFPVEVHGAPSIKGWFGPPGDATTQAANLEIFVNRRPVQEPSVRAAVRRAYGSFLEHGYTPTGVLYISLDGAALDVNVHPAKTQVRFSDPSSVFRSVLHAVRSAVAQTPWLDTLRSQQQREEGTKGAELFPNTDPAGSEHGLTVNQRQRSYESDPGYDDGPGHEVRSSAIFPGVQTEAPAGIRLSGTRFLGQVARAFLLFQDDTRLLVVDQHALDEIVLFGEIQRTFQTDGVPVKPLLFPEEVLLDAQRMEWALTHVGTLLRLGFEVEAGGPDRLWVRAAPSLIRHRSVPEAILGLLEILETRAAETTEAGVEEALCRWLACQGALRAGDVLSGEDVEDLVAGLDRIPRLPFLPHGRNPIAQLDYVSLAALFESANKFP